MRAETPKVAFYLFYAPDCEHCQAVRQEVIPLLQLEHNLEIRELNIEEMQNYLILCEIEKRYGRENTQVPVVVIGQELLSGEEEVRRLLEEVIKRYEQAGGVGLVPLPEVALKKASGDKTINGVYFFKHGCAKCSRVFYNLKTIQAEYPMLKLRQLEIGEEENLVLAEALGRFLGVPKEKRLVAPSIFIGRDYLIGDEVTLEALRKLVDKYKITGAPPIWEVDEATLAAARQEIVGRFTSFALTTVAMAGLVDGVNPCAFATIIFLVSYLGFIGRSGREILGVGISFALAVFLTYFLIGLGLFRFVEQLSFMPVVARVVYIGTGGLALVLGLVSLWDFRKCLKGEAEDMALQLPRFLKRRIHKVIREEARTRNYMIAAFVTGFFISLLELVCTGQVYLPTIIYVTRIPGMVWHGVAYLLWYNLFFILPLVVVFLLVYYGVTSEELARFMRRHVAAVKLATAVLFFVLGGILLFSV